MSRAIRTIAVAVSATSLLVSVAPTPTAAATSSREGIPRFGHVFLIIGENTTYSHLKMTNAPYLLGTIRPASAWLTEYRAATHWSQANYVALTSGQFTKCEQQDYGIACHQNVPNLFHQLDVENGTWQGAWTTWLEGGTARCDTGSGSLCGAQGPCPLAGFYTTGNPAILYDDVEGATGVWSETDKSDECIHNDVYAGGEKHPMGTFNGALADGTVPAFNFVIPNGCDDGEANCKPLNDRYLQFDTFLKREIPKIEASPAFGDDGLIIVTYDEDERQDGLAKKWGFGMGGQVVCAFLGPQVRPGAYDGSFYHYSVLRTLEDGFDLNGYVGYANDVTPIAGIWRP
jgi:phosphatidylinositol-3-phosphatase